MKPTARLINCARGGIVDEEALFEALKAGKIAGAALDVFESEPLGESQLRSLGKELILTPHLGASTAEAQVNVAIDVAEQIRDVLLGLPARSAVNILDCLRISSKRLNPTCNWRKPLAIWSVSWQGGELIC
jgi:D-3-phosphoglycerate dehydrogenase